MDLTVLKRKIEWAKEVGCLDVPVRVEEAEKIVKHLETTAEILVRTGESLAEANAEIKALHKVAKELSENLDRAIQSMQIAKSEKEEFIASISDALKKTLGGVNHG